MSHPCQEGVSRNAQVQNNIELHCTSDLHSFTCPLFEFVLDMASNDFLLASRGTFTRYWDEGMGDEGNEYFRFLELPILEKLIGRLEGYHAIDLATGNGLVARWLAQKAASVMATDGAATMIDRVRRERTAPYMRT